MSIRHKAKAFTFVGKISPIIRSGMVCMPMLNMIMKLSNAMIDTNPYGSMSISVQPLRYKNMALASKVRAVPEREMISNGLRPEKSTMKDESADRTSWIAKYIIVAVLDEMKPFASSKMVFP